MALKQSCLSALSRLGLKETQVRRPAKIFAEKKSEWRNTIVADLSGTEVLFPTSLL